MPADRTRPGDPLAELPALRGELDPTRPEEMPRTLAGELIPVADSIRELYSAFGIRAYRCYLVHGQWSGQRRGEGVLQIISRRELTPTPRVRDLGQVSEVLRSTGLTEEGGVVIDQISGRYTEDDLMGLTPDLQEPALQRTSRAMVEFFWEIVESRPSTPTPIVRRFRPVSVPMLSRDGFAWTVGLTKQDFDSGRTGTTVPRDAF